MGNTTELKIDRAGRIVIPKSIRERLGLNPGKHLEAREEEGGLLLKSAAEKAPLVLEKGLWVHQGEPVGALSVPEIIDEVREGRHVIAEGPLPRKHAR
jgi:AbrB family looped-hinge helix DNA binding protein